MSDILNSQSTELLITEQLILFRWLGKNSSQRKRQREVRELRALTSPASYGATTQGILFDYAKGLLDLINYNLQTSDKVIICQEKN